MKFQDSSFNGLKVTVGTKSVTHSRTHAPTHAPKAICPINFFKVGGITSSPKGNDAHLRATIQSEKKWKDQFFRRLRAASSVVRGRI